MIPKGTPKYWAAKALRWFATLVVIGLLGTLLGCVVVVLYERTGSVWGVVALPVALILIPSIVWAGFAHLEGDD